MGDSFQTEHGCVINAHLVYFLVCKQRHEHVSSEFEQREKFHRKSIVSFKYRMQ